MLTHKHRFHGHGSLRYLYRHGKAARNRYVMVRYVENKRRLHSRVAIIVSKKVMKTAVGRNRIRRRIFEIIRNEWLHLPDGYDISLTVYSPECLTMPTDELHARIIEVLSQAGLYKKT